MTHRGIALLAALAFASGCSDSTTEPIVGFDGALSFTYTGGGGGTHNASGDFTSQGQLGTSSWAVGTRQEADGLLGVVSVQPRSSTTHDFTILAVTRLTPGSSGVGAGCDPDVDVDCTGIVFYRGVSNSGFTYDFFCVLTTGSVAISSISTTRAQGTFSGTGFCYDFDGEEQPFTATNGTFNVALISDTQFPG
ncbi:MAG: hypothetical protein WD801_02495 [Gemmatimonadaceae bacterium]